MENNAKYLSNNTKKQRSKDDDDDDTCWNCDGEGCDECEDY
jgi:hypothetical protein